MGSPMGNQTGSQMRVQGKPGDVNPDFYPALYQRTDTAATSYQDWYFRAVTVEVILSVFGGLAVVVTQIPTVSQPLNDAIGVQLFGGKILPLSLATALALLLTGITLLVRYRWQPGEHWRQSRFVGESDASLAWRYSVKASGFDLGNGPVTYSSAEQWYTFHVKELLDQARKLNLRDGGKNDEITALMTQTRNAPLQERFELYRDLRAQNQRDWYDRKAQHFKQRRNLWRGILVAVYFIGVALLVMHGTGLRTLIPFGVLDANFWPLVAAAAGGITAWVTARHFEDLVQSYEYMRGRLTLELDNMKAFVANATNEPVFAHWVDRVENLMDAEHQQWHALS